MAAIADQQEAADRVRAWIHGTGLSRCPNGTDDCADWPLATALVHLAEGEITQDDAAALASAQIIERGPSDAQVWLTAAIFAAGAAALVAILAVLVT